MFGFLSHRAIYGAEHFYSSIPVQPLLRVAKRCARASAHDTFPNTSCAFSCTRNLYNVKSGSTTTSTKETVPFEYSPLNPTRPEIRLIRILRAEQASDTLCCQLYTVRLDSKPQYVALSYTWGDNARIQPILVNGRQFHVTRNLEHFLRHSRAVIKDGALLWIDAICINQDDDIEKSGEVQRMLSIYRDATLVIVWLGLSTKSLDSATAQLNEFLTFYSNSDKQLYESAEDFIRTCETASGTYSGIEDIQALVRRPWFRRIWIVQEIAAAKHVHYVCETGSVPGAALPPLVTAIENIVMKDMRKVVDEYMEPRSLTCARYDLDWKAPIFFQLIDLIKRRGSPPSLWNLLLAFKESRGRASDPRDYIFALLGLAKDTYALGLRPDYSGSVSSCFINVARTLLKNGQLRLLWLCSQSKNTLDLPSWVPDWSTYWNFQSCRHILEDYRPRVEVLSMPQNIYSVSAACKPSISFHGKHNEVLRMNGIHLDTVSNVRYPHSPMLMQAQAESKNPEDETVSTFVSTSSSYWPYEEFVMRYESIEQLYSESLLNPEDKADTMLRTLLRNIEMGNPSIEETSTFAQYYSQRAIQYNKLTPSRLGEIRKKIAQKPKPEDSTSTVWANLLPQSDLRTPFITSRGYLGLGPAKVEKGDIVVILLGAEVPFILRETHDDRYILIGDTYVDGIMEGQAMEAEQTIQDFDIV